MITPLRLLALDLGAESGRAVIGKFDGSHLQIEEAHRFPNVPVRVGGTLYWDVLRLYGDVLSGLRAAILEGALETVGVDAWSRFRIARRPRASAAQSGTLPRCTHERRA